MDNSLFSFWTLNQLVDANEKYKSDFTLFGDFLIDSHYCGFKYENENLSSVYSDFESGKLLKIADSVEEFFNLYLTSPIEVGFYQE